jgi:hypothetical protein
VLLWQAYGVPAWNEKGRSGSLPSLLDLERKFRKQTPERNKPNRTPETNQCEMRMGSAAAAPGLVFFSVRRQWGSAAAGEAEASGYQDERA